MLLLSAAAAATTTAPLAVNQVRIFTIIFPHGHNNIANEVHKAMVLLLCRPPMLLLAEAPNYINLNSSAYHCEWQDIHVGWRGNFRFPFAVQLQEWVSLSSLAMGDGICAHSSLRDNNTSSWADRPTYRERDGRDDDDEELQRILSIVTSMSLFFDYSPLLILHLTLRRVVVVRYVLFPVHTPNPPTPSQFLLWDHNNQRRRHEHRSSVVVQC